MDRWIDILSHVYVLSDQLISRDISLCRDKGAVDRLIDRKRGRNGYHSRTVMLRYM